MPETPLRLLIVESEPPATREERRNSVGRTSGETYADVLSAIAPCRCDEIRPCEPGARLPDGAALEGYDGVFLTGSPLHLYEDTPAVRAQIAFMRDVFDSGTPAFGSCAGLQVATVAAGGQVQPNARGREVAFARRIVATAEGARHPLLRGRPAAYDAPAIHTDEVARLPEGATLLARNPITDVQAAEIRFGHGVFWGVQYHPELSLGEIAAALRRQAKAIVQEGFAADEPDLHAHADLIDELGREPSRRDLAWKLGADEQLTQDRERQRELRNFIEHLVRPSRSARARA